MNTLKTFWAALAMAAGLATIAGCQSGHARSPLETPPALSPAAPPTRPGGCWVDAECPAGQQCEGASKSTGAGQGPGRCVAVALAPASRG